MESTEEQEFLKAELKSQEHEKKLLKKDLRRRESFLCLLAAHSLYSAEVHSLCVEKISLKEAKDASSFINMFIENPNEKTTPHQFMRSPEDEANEALNSFQIYKSIIELLPDRKRVIEGFSKWYINSGWKAVRIKCYYHYIENIAGLLILRDLRRISEKEFHESLWNLISIKHPFLFNFDAGKIKRSFVKVMQKFDEINKKVDIRSVQKPVLKVVN